ncbi:rhodanese-like domain-containing protein [Maribacter sp.]|uniref:rhodanese-like domain-containing protein n=1 Tax=Maribacter sp. TaxID=1897614 RepID=UPI0025C19ABF|nr:rhodanese-like domain-containing protein [Maribacter sp.]
MKKTLLIITFLFIGIIVISQSLKKQAKEKMDIEKTYPKSFTSYNDFKNLVQFVEIHREKRLINLDTFLKMSKEENVFVLDTRSEFRYKRKHLKGAIHLSFSDFTQENLRKILPLNTNTKILIYCNNNFNGDQIDLASKMSIPNVLNDSLLKPKEIETQILSNQKPIMLALNIPTYINLYGYGYRNIYELDELVDVNDSRIVFEGTKVKTSTTNKE